MSQTSSNSKYNEVCVYISIFDVFTHIESRDQGVEKRVKVGPGAGRHIDTSEYVHPHDREHQPEDDQQCLAAGERCYNNSIW